jgi:sugar phosphate isomerase/epimerase
MAIYVSTGAFRSQWLPDIVEKAERMGITHLELSSGCKPMPDFEAFVPRLAASSLTFAVHNYFPAPLKPFVLNLGALDRDLLERSRDHVRRSLALTSQLGGSYYSVHAAFVHSMAPNLLGKPALQARTFGLTSAAEREKVRGVFVSSLKLLAQEAYRMGLMLLVENNVIAPPQVSDGGENPFLMVSADEIEEILTDVNAPNLGLLLDVAHARVSAMALNFDCDEFISRLKPWIRVVHLSENNSVEDSNLALTENAWFWKPLELTSRNDVVIEVYRLNDDAILDQIALVRRKLA